MSEEGGAPGRDQGGAPGRGESGAPGRMVHGFVVQRWHLDQFGHMNVRWYAHLFDDAVWMLWGAMGLPQDALLRDHGCHTVTAAAATDFRRECVDGDLIRVEGRLARIGTKSVTFDLDARTGRSGAVHAACRVTEVFVSPGDHASMPIPDAVRAALAAWRAADGA